MSIHRSLGKFMKCVLELSLYPVQGVCAIDSLLGQIIEDNDFELDCRQLVVRNCYRWFSFVQGVVSEKEGNKYPFNFLY